MLREIPRQFLVWFGIFGGLLTKFKPRLGRRAVDIPKNLWIVFAVLLAGNVMAFNYYQARVSRYYLHIMHMNIVRMNGDIDLLDGKLNQLSAKIDGLEAKINQLSAKNDSLSAKLDKPALSSPATQAQPPHRCTGLFC
jgi:outer membrane murein-binding lipoprotein Lpp